MYKLDLPVDRKEAAAIERRRALEEQRKGRIFNAKNRLIGVDERALAQQLKEKKEREDEEHCRELAYAHDAERFDRIAVLCEQRQRKDMRKLDQALNEFRFLHQQPQSRREFDLYDPDALKKDRPARVTDDDPRCGISSMQKFMGEDLTRQSRNKYQREQMQDWFERQIEEREAAEAAYKEANRLYDLKRRELDQRVCELAKAEEQCKRAVNTALRHYNEVLAAEQAERARIKKQHDEDDNATEIANCIYSDLLTENPAQATSAFGPHRICPDRYKGLTQEQLDHIRKTQQLQVEEKKRLKAEEEERNREWDCQRVNANKVGILIERQMERAARNAREKIAQENLRLAQDQMAFQQYLKDELYTNQPTAAYFAQFNTTSR
ncbi:hypothetical protein AAHC03_09240 [Spirometra sp. Aus1]